MNKYVFVEIKNTFWFYGLICARTCYYFHTDIGYFLGNESDSIERMAST